MDPLGAVEVDERKIDAIFAQLNQCHLPGAAVGIALDGKPVYRKGFGLANMELPVTLTPSMRMRIYSATKHFTCLSYLLLCEDGRAGVDDPIGKHFPEFHPVTRKVTVRQLMGNVSGLRDAHGLHFLFSGTHWIAPSSQTMEMYRTIDDVDAPPGTTWFYNNAGFVLIGEAIERLSGKSLGEFMRERIFEPVGMHDTLLRRQDTDFLPHSAAMHMTAPQGGFIKLTLGGDRGGTGGIVSTVNDMLRWLAHMDAPTVGSAKTWALMKTPQILANGVSTGYGFGLIRDNYRGIETLYHPGSGMGANAQVLKVPAAKLDIIIMVNREDVSSRELSLKILDTCLPGLHPLRTVKAPVVDGVFRSRTTGRVLRLYGENGMQMAGAGGVVDLQYAPDDDGVLWPVKSTVLPYQYGITVLGDPQNPGGVRFSDYGNVDELTRVAPADKTALSMIAGQYRSEATGTDVTISTAGMRTVGRFGSVDYALQCIGKDVWQAKAVSSPAPFLSATLSFDDGGFGLWSYCARGLPFRRVR